MVLMISFYFKIYKTLKILIGFGMGIHSKVLKLSFLTISLFLKTIKTRISCMKQYLENKQCLKMSSFLK